MTIKATVEYDNYRISRRILILMVLEDLQNLNVEEYIDRYNSGESLETCFDDIEGIVDVLTQVGEHNIFYRYSIEDFYTNDLQRYQTLSWSDIYSDIIDNFDDDDDGVNKLRNFIKFLKNTVRKDYLVRGIYIDW